MRILLTGCTGFVGRFVLRELLEKYRDSDTQILCLLRSKKGQTIQQRWIKEIETDSLYYEFKDSLKKVILKEGELDHLSGIQWSTNENPTLILHCAANVKTLDTYTNLYADNVLGVKNICEAALQWNCPRLILISTCYVHPRNTVGKSILLQEGLPKSLFTTDYTYTKYLGEHLAASYSSKLKISLLRLSCVGAPMGWLDAHPTPSAMAHLGIVSLILRSRLLYARIPSTMYLSTIPVDLVARCIVEELSHTSDTLRIQQICAGPESVHWNLSIHRLCSTILQLAPKTPFKMVDVSEEEFQRKLLKFIGWSYYTPWGYKQYRFHKEVNDFISKFADGQRFESSIPDSYFPTNLQESQIYQQTCIYVARGIHQYQTERGSKKSVLDKFWTNLPSHDILGRIQFRQPIEFSNKEEAIQRFYDCFGAYRPFFSAVEDPSVLKYVDSSRISIRWAQEDSPGQLGCTHWNKSTLYLELLGTYDAVKGFRMMGHHGMGDGVALLTLLPRINSLYKEIPVNQFPEPTSKSTSLSWAQEFGCFMYYLAMFILLFFRPCDESRRTVSNTVQRSIVTDTIKLQKDPGKTFTVSLINKTYPIFRSALQRETLIYCIPAIVQNPKERGLNLPQNVFVPILLPWTSEDTWIQELCMKSKSVKLLSWIFVQLITITDFYWIRDRFNQRIDVIFSSLLASEQPLDFVESFHYFAPTPDEVPFTVSALTLGTNTDLSIGSSMPEYSAKTLLDQCLFTT